MTFEACSGFTHVTGRWVARRPKAAFVAGLRRGRLPRRIARQLPGQSTIACVEPPSTDTQRLRGALPPVIFLDRWYPRAGLVPVSAEEVLSDGICSEQV
jgi:hypothetical protein